MKQENKVTKDDLLGDVSDFPIEILQAMCDEQVRQGYDFDVSVFQKDAGAGNGGFFWELSEEGKYFWINVIADKNFNRYFSLYPKENCSEHVDVLSQDIIVESVKGKYDSRIELGIKKYKTTLNDNNGDIQEFLTHLQEELMDATLYIEKLMTQVYELNNIINGADNRNTKTSSK